MGFVSFLEDVRDQLDQALDAARELQDDSPSAARSAARTIATLLRHAEAALGEIRALLEVSATTDLDAAAEIAALRAANDDLARRLESAEAKHAKVDAERAELDKTVRHLVTTYTSPEEIARRLAPVRQLKRDLARAERLAKSKGHTIDAARVQEQRVAELELELSGLREANDTLSKDASRLRRRIDGLEADLANTREAKRLAEDANARYKIRLRSRGQEVQESERAQSKGGQRTGHDRFLSRPSHGLRLRGDLASRDDGHDTDAVHRLPFDPRWDDEEA